MPSKPKLLKMNPHGSENPQKSKKESKLASTHNPRPKRPQPSKEYPTTKAVLKLVLAVLSANLPHLIKTQNENIQTDYRMHTRKVPLNIKLLKDDIMIYYFFDYTKFPDVYERTDLQANYSFDLKPKLFNYYSDPITQNRSYFEINASKILSLGKTSLKQSYFIVAKFRNLTTGKLHIQVKNYSFMIYVIDKYQPSPLNFEEFKPNFLLNIKSGEQGVSYPMSSAYIFGNDMNVSVELIPDPASKNNTKNSSGHPSSSYGSESKLGKWMKADLGYGSSSSGNHSKPAKKIYTDIRELVNVSVSNRAYIWTIEFFSRLEGCTLYKLLVLDENHAISIMRVDTDQTVFKIRFFFYQRNGEPVLLDTVEAVNFELVRLMRIHANQYLLIFRNGKESSMEVFFSIPIQIEPAEKTAALTTLSPTIQAFNSKYQKQVYKNQNNSPVSTTFFRISEAIIKVFYLQKVYLDEPPVPQRIIILYSSFVSNGRKRFDDVVLDGLLEDVNAMLARDIGFNITFGRAICDEVRTITDTILNLRVQLYKSKNINDSEPLHMVFAKIRILEITNSSEYDNKNYELLSLVSPPFTKTNYLQTCYVSFQKFANERATQDHIISPFTIAFFEESLGLFALSANHEFIEYLKPSEIPEGFKLGEGLCGTFSRTYTLRFFNMKLKQELLYVFNMNGKEKADNRILYKHRAQRDHVVTVADASLSQLFEMNSNNVSINIVYLMDGSELLQSRIYINTNYPKITLNTTVLPPGALQNKVNGTLRIYNTANKSGYFFESRIEIEPLNQTYINTTKLASAEFRDVGKVSDLEKLVDISGPLQSIQVVNHTKGIRILPRLRHEPAFPDTQAEEYIHVRFSHGGYFFGTTPKQVLYKDLSVNSSLPPSTVPHSLKPMAITAKDGTFWIFFYKDSSPPVFMITSYKTKEVIPLNGTQNQEKTTNSEKDLNQAGKSSQEIPTPPKNSSNSTVTKTKILEVKMKKIIPNDYFSSINYLEAKPTLKSLSNSTVCFVLRTSQTIQPIIVQNYGLNNQSVAANRIISLNSIGIIDVMNDVDIAQFNNFGLPIFGMFVATHVGIIQKFILYQKQGGSDVKIDHGPVLTFRENDSVDCINCEPVQLVDRSMSKGTIIVDCVLSIRSSTLKEVQFEYPYTYAQKQVINNTTYKPSFRASGPSYNLINEYSVPVNSEVIYIHQTSKYIAILAKDNELYSMELILYKKGVREAWSSIYTPYQGKCVFDMNEDEEGVTWLYIQVNNDPLISYQVGDLGLYVVKNINLTKQKFSLFYSGSNQMSYVNVSTSQITVDIPRRPISPMEWVNFWRTMVVAICATLISFGACFGLCCICCCCCCLVYNIQDEEEAPKKRRKRKVLKIVKKKDRKGSLGTVKSELPSPSLRTFESGEIPSPGADSNYMDSNNQGNRNLTITDGGLEMKELRLDLSKVSSETDQSFGLQQGLLAS